MSLRFDIGVLSLGFFFFLSLSLARRDPNAMSSRKERGFPSQDVFGEDDCPLVVWSVRVRELDASFLFAVFRNFFFLSRPIFLLLRTSISNSHKRYFLVSY